MARFDPITKINQGRKIPQIYHPKASIGDILIHKFYHSPQRVIQVNDDDGTELTSHEIAQMMKSVAINLKQNGYQCGDIVGLIANSSNFIAPIMFGCFLLHLPINVLDTSFSVSQIVDIYQETRPKIIFIDHHVFDKVLAAIELLQLEAQIVVITERIEGYLHITDLMNFPQNNDE